MACLREATKGLAQNPSPSGRQSRLSDPGPWLRAHTSPLHLLFRKHYWTCHERADALAINAAVDFLLDTGRGTRVPHSRAGGRAKTAGHMLGIILYRERVLVCSKLLSRPGNRQQDQAILSEERKSLLNRHLSGTAKPDLIDWVHSPDLPGIETSLRRFSRRGPVEQCSQAGTSKTTDSSDLRTKSSAVLPA